MHFATSNCMSDMHFHSSNCMSHVYIAMYVSNGYVHYNAHRAQGIAVGKCGGEVHVPGRSLVFVASSAELQLQGFPAELRVRQRLGSEWVPALAEHGLLHGERHQLA
jgi:hypothetical protein